MHAHQQQIIEGMIPRPCRSDLTKLFLDSFEVDADMYILCNIYPLVDERTRKDGSGPFGHRQACPDE